jgi:NTE family protein
MRGNPSFTASIAGSLRHAFVGCAVVGAALGAAAEPSPTPAVLDAPTPSAERPCTGTALVLSGGGARGGAHVGVLKVMEELRVPVSCVIGTSMGSIVGGLYASGMSPQRLDEQLTAIDWEGAFSDEPDRTKQRFRTKQDDVFGLFPIEVGVGKDGVNFSPGITAGFKVEFILRSLTLHASTTTDFDRLRLPYRAVASDLATGEMVVMDGGDLALSMRASMSIPGAFTPVVIDGRTLVDGMVARNFPIDVAQALGATRVIAVDVGTPASQDVKGISATGAIAQMVALLTDQNVIAQRALLKEQDLLITPKLGDISSSSFGRVKEARDAGEAAARAASEQLKRFSVSKDEFDAYLRKQRFASTSMPQLASVKVVVEGDDGKAVEAPHLLDRIKTKAGAPLDLAVLEEDMVRVMQAGEYESVNFDMERAADGQRALTIKARAKSWGPGYLRLGLGMESNLEGSTDFRLLLSYRRPNVTEYGGELKVNAAIGTPSSILAEYFQPLERAEYWFVAPYAGWERRVEERATVLGDELLRIDDTRLGADLGMQFRNVGEFRLGAFSGRSVVSPETATLIPEFRADLGGWRFKAVRDQIDSLYFPTFGDYTTFTFVDSNEDLGADDEYQRLELSSAYAFTRGRNTFVSRLAYGTTPDGTLPVYDQLELGGFMNLSGYTRDELRGDEMLLLSLADYWRFVEFGTLGRSYVGAVLEAGNVWRQKDMLNLGDLKGSLMVFLGVDNKITPIYLGLAINDEGDTQGYLYVGHPF